MWKVPVLPSLFFLLFFTHCRTWSIRKRYKRLPSLTQAVSRRKTVPDKYDYRYTSFGNRYDNRVTHRCDVRKRYTPFGDNYDNRYTPFGDIDDIRYTVWRYTRNPLHPVWRQIRRPLHTGNSFSPFGV